MNLPQQLRLALCYATWRSVQHSTR